MAWCIGPTTREPETWVSDLREANGFSRQRSGSRHPASFSPGLAKRIAPCGTKLVARPPFGMQRSHK